MKTYEFFLKIADIVIRIETKNSPRKYRNSKLRYDKFILSKKPARIDIDLTLETKASYKKFTQVKLFEALSNYSKKQLAKMLIDRKRKKLVTEDIKNYLGDALDWRISRLKGKILIEGISTSRYQVILEPSLKKGKIFIISRDKRWSMSRIVHGFLQVLVIYYLAKYKIGIIIHSAAVKDKHQGYLFAGVSRAGKSTISRIWNEATSAFILNDDRIVIKKKNRSYYMHGTPWHGDYIEYFDDYKSKAKLSKIFGIYHSKVNKRQKLKPIESFSVFFQSLFVSFWDKECLDFVLGFLSDMFREIPTYKLGFKKDKQIIEYVRNVQ